MIPENINIAELAAELEEDLVAMGAATGEQYPTLEPDLIGVATGAGEGDFGSLGVVVLDETPAMSSDLRDIAQDLLDSTSLDTIVVRAPASGAVVSDVHSRAALEAGQHELLGTVDFVAGTESLVRSVTESGVSSIDWLQVSLIAGAVILVLLVASAVSVVSAHRKSATV